MRGLQLFQRLVITSYLLSLPLYRQGLLPVLMIKQEAIAVRIEKNQLSNSTVKARAVSDIVDEATERYSEAYRIK
jgi:hypothetical protein